MKKWIVSGNLARNAVVNERDERDMLTFTVASNNGKNAKADFIDVVVWGKKGFAANILPYLVQGKNVTVSGKAKKLPPVEKDGVVYNNVICSVQSLYQVELSGGSSVKPAAEHQPDSPQPMAEETKASEAAQKSLEDQNYDSFDDDIPF